MRIDKYLWCVRLAKTRSQAAALCAEGRVVMGDIVVKPAREVKPNEELRIKDNPVYRSYRIKAIPKSRVSAALVAEYLSETTGALELEQLEMVRRMNAENRLQGIVGRPTKRDRRDLDRFKEN